MIVSPHQPKIIADSPYFIEPTKLVKPLEAVAYAQKQEMVKVPVATPKPVTTAPSGSHADWMRQAGIAESDFTYVEYIIQKESGWNYLAKNPTSSATGLCQTMLSIHKVSETFRSNPVEQLQWCQNYAIGRYKSWSGAYNFWLSNHWW